MKIYESKQEMKRMKGSGPYYHTDGSLRYCRGTGCRSTKTQMAQEDFDSIIAHILTALREKKRTKKK